MEGDTMMGMVVEEAEVSLRIVCFVFFFQLRYGFYVTDGVGAEPMSSAFVLIQVMGEMEEDMGEDMVVGGDMVVEADMVGTMMVTAEVSVGLSVLFYAVSRYFTHTHTERSLWLMGTMVSKASVLTLTPLFVVPITDFHLMNLLSLSSSLLLQAEVVVEEGTTTAVEDMTAVDTTEVCLPNNTSIYRLLSPVTNYLYLS